MLEFEEKVLKFKFRDTIHEIEYPTVRLVNDFRKDVNEKDEVEAMLLMLEKLGLQRKISEALRISQLAQLVNELTSELVESKKN